MKAMIAAIRAGHYAQAYEALHQATGVDPTVRTAIAAFLLALAERFDEADQLLGATDLPAIRVIVAGERQRLTRWRDPEANGSLNATTSTPLVPLYVAVACAFVRGNTELADRAKAQLAEHATPVSGRLTFITGEVRAFSDLSDSDDGIGQMLETYCGEGLLYYPFSSLRRVELLPRNNFMDHLMPKAAITDDRGTASAYVPLLYAASSTAPDDHVRSGRTTLFDYLGAARRGIGQRDLVLDGTALVGIQHVAVIDFD